MKLMKIGITIAVAAIILGSVFAWGTVTAGTHVAEKTCQELGFDGLIQVDGELLCYTTCPFYAAVNGTCQP